MRRRCAAMLQPFIPLRRRGKKTLQDIAPAPAPATPAQIDRAMIPSWPYVIPFAVPLFSTLFVPRSMAAHMRLVPPRPSFKPSILALFWPPRTVAIRYRRDSGAGQSAEGQKQGWMHGRHYFHMDIAKNEAQLFTLFSLANLVLARRQLPIYGWSVSWKGHTGAKAPWKPGFGFVFGEIPDILTKFLTETYPDF